MIAYMKNAHIQNLFETAAKEYRKKSVTLLRWPHFYEVGTALVTWVKDDSFVRIETIDIISPDSLIARNPVPLYTLGDEIYNEWIVSSDTVRKNYGEINATCEFKPFQKSATVKAILCDKQIFEIFNITGDEFPIKVPWSTSPMIVKCGDYLTSEGYSISSHDMTLYQIVE